MPERLTRQEQQQRNRLRLLAAAEKVFDERGIQRASLDEVAAEAGLTKGAVYSNFASKEDLVLAVMRHRMRETAQAQAELLRCADRTPEQLVDGFGRHWAATVAGGEQEHFTRVALEFMIHALRHPAAREQLLALLFASPEGSATQAEAHPLAPGRSRLAALTPQHTDAIVLALDIGLGLLCLLDPERCPPELFPVALRLLAGMDVDASVIPAGAPATP